jgi:hypothetical protein
MKTSGIDEFLTTLAIEHHLLIFGLTLSNDLLPATSLSITCIICTFPTIDDVRIGLLVYDPALRSLHEFSACCSCMTGA